MKEILHAPLAAGPFGPAVTRIDTSIRYLCAIILWVSFFMMLIPTFANAFLRYTTDASIVWSEQMVRLVFPWLILSGAVLAAQHNRHISVVALINILGPTMLRGLQIIIQLIIMVSCAIVFDFALGITLEDESMYTLIGIGQSWSYLALVVGYALLFLTTSTNIYRLITDPKYSAKIKSNIVD